jgi:pimeloyl-ACP methyl ester carboxylesterase
MRIFHCAAFWRFFMSTVAIWRSSSAAKRATALRCTIHGKGPSLLLVHGLGTSGAVFAPLIPLLSQHYQLIIPDLRGHGHSRRLPLPISREQLVEDLEGLLNLLGIISCAAIGHDDGCALVQMLAQRNPAAVDSLGFISGYARKSRNPLRNASETAWWLLGSRAMAERNARLARAPEAQYVRSLMRENDGSRVAAVAHTLQYFDSSAWLAQLKVPSCVVVGDSDAASRRQQSQELARLLPLAQLQVLAGAGHWLTYTHSEELAGLLLNWLHEEYVA